MTKQLDLFMQLRDDDAFIYPPEMKVYPSHILCPNCMKVKLIQTSGYDYSCTNCNYDFTGNQKSLKFK